MQLGVEFVDLTAVSIPVELASYVPKNIAKKFCVVPVKLVKDTLYLAMSDPLDFVAQEEVKVASRKRVIPMIATRRTTEHAISLLYGSEGTAGVIEEMKREANSSTPDIVPVQVSQEAMDSGDSAPTIRFVNSLIERAFSERASDIHLEPQDGEMVVRMRIDGLLRRVLTVPLRIAEHRHLAPQDHDRHGQLQAHQRPLRPSGGRHDYGVPRGEHAQGRGAEPWPRLARPRQLSDDGSAARGQDSMPESVQPLYVAMQKEHTAVCSALEQLEK